MKEAQNIHKERTVNLGNRNLRTKMPLGNAREHLQDSTNVLKVFFNLNLLVKLASIPEQWNVKFSLIVVNITLARPTNQKAAVNH